MMLISHPFDIGPIILIPLTGIPYAIAALIIVIIIETFCLQYYLELSFARAFLYSLSITLPLHWSASH